MRKKENLWTLDQAAALAALAETYGAPCRTLAQNFLGDAYEAETCFQDACRQVWQAGQGQGDLLSALLRATRRLAWQRAPEGGRPDALIQELDRALPRREAPALPGGEGTAVWAAFFRGMLPESRRLFLRRYFFGDGIGPLAVAARQNEVAVHDQLSRLRQQLVQRLEEAGALPPDGAALFAALEGVEDPWLREAAGVRVQSRRRWLPALIGGGAGVALIAAILLFVPWDTPAAQGMAGEPGVLQDGAYYVYVGSGFALPNQNRTPEGIFRYIPGQGAEELVSCADHPIVTGANYGWDVNSHGLYYIDRETGQLFRQDLESGAETLLYTIPDEDFYLPEDQLDEGDLWDYYVHGETPEVLIPAAIRFQEVTEDQVVLTYRHTDGASNDTLVLDSRTGEELSRTPDPDPREGWTTRLGDRVIETVVMPHTEGFTYPGWEEDAETNAYHWTGSSRRWSCPTPRASPTPAGRRTRRPTPTTGPIFGRTASPSSPRGPWRARRRGPRTSGAGCSSATAPGRPWTSRATMCVTPRGTFSSPPRGGPMTSPPGRRRTCGPTTPRQGRGCTSPSGPGRTGTPAAAG